MSDQKKTQLQWRQRQRWQLFKTTTLFNWVIMQIHIYLNQEVRIISRNFLEQLVLLLLMESFGGCGCIPWSINWQLVSGFNCLLFLLCVWYCLLNLLHVFDFIAIVWQLFRSNTEFYIFATWLARYFQRGARWAMVNSYFACWHFYHFHLSKTHQERCDCKKSQLDNINQLWRV